MKTVLAFVLCLIFSAAVNCQKLAEVSNTFKKKTIAPNTLNRKLSSLSQPGSNRDRNSAPVCNGNGNVIFVNSSSQPLYFYYWYVEDVANASHECRFRRFWKQLDAGNNQFKIAKNKTMIFRICTSSQCSSSFIKQFGIVRYCNINNGIILVK